LKRHQAIPRDIYPSAIEYQLRCEHKLLLYPESVPVLILKKRQKYSPELGIFAQLIDCSFQVKSQELSNNGILWRKIYIDPGSHSLGPRIYFFH
jgi:hypothetical protein